MLLDVSATTAHRGNRPIGGGQALADRLQLLAQQLPLVTDSFEQPAALDGQVNQLLIHRAQRLSVGEGLRPAR